jgi:hypothetical protein
MNPKNFTRLFIFLALFFCGESIAQTPQFRWASIFEAYSNTGSVNLNDITVDQSGNVYAVGVLYDTADFDPGPGVVNLIGQFDNFICKLDSNGALLWVKAIKTAVYENTNSIAVDNSGNVYVSGQFRNTCDFDPGAGVFNLISNGTTDAFVCKLNAFGDFVWAKSAGGIGFDRAVDMALDASNNVYLTGSFEGTADFDPGSSKADLTAHASFYDAYIWKLDANGNYVWAKSVGGTADVISYSLAVDNRGVVYTTGMFGGAVDFDPGPGAVTIKGDSVNRSIFVLKLSSGGLFSSVKPVHGSGYKDVRGITLDKSGSIYVTGEFTKVIDFDPGDSTHKLSSADPFSYDAFICKLDSNSSFIWAKSFRAGHNINNAAAGFNIVVDDSNNVFSSGLFRDTVDFDPSAAGTAYLTTPSSDFYAYVSKLDANGDFRWVRSIASKTNDINPSIALDKKGNIYGGGWFYGNVNFDPGPSSTYRSAGQHSGYVFKWSGSGIPTGVPETKPAGSYNGVTISPIPASDHLIIRCENPALFQKDAFIYDVQGRLLHRFKLSSVNRIDVSSWVPGVYYLQTPDGFGMKMDQAEIMGDDNISRHRDLLSETERTLLPVRL